MKKLLLQFVLILLFNHTAFTQEDWFWENPLPQGNDLKDVWVQNQNTIFTVGDRGTLLHSDNGGADWEIIHRLVDISENIVDIQFVSEQKGFLLANNLSSKILATNDSGINWEVIAEFDSMHLNNLSFIDDNIGWVIGCSVEQPIMGKILKTTDGGHNWDTMYVEYVLGGFSAIQFVDYENGWAAGKYGGNFGATGELLKTTDGGLNWSLVCDSVYTITNLQFLNSDIGWSKELIGCWGSCHWIIKKTTDGGLNWEDIFTGFSHNGSPLEFFFINTNTGWVKERGNMHKTIDGGLTWLTIAQNTPADAAMHFSDDLNGCIVGNNGGILTTLDGGQSWIERSTMTLSLPLLAVDFYDGNIGWVTAIWSDRWSHDRASGIIYNTNDGGVSWEEQLFIRGGKNYFGIINDVQAIDNEIAYAVGLNVYKTTDGGANWNVQSYPEANAYNALFFLNADTGFIGSGRGLINNGFDDLAIIYKTADGGLEWDTVFSATVQNTAIGSLFFINNSVGWALCRNYSQTYIYKTTDEGNNWQELAVNDFSLNSICFNNENIGLAVGKDGVVIRSTDGGFNWDTVYNLYECRFESVYFIDSGKAIVVGREGNHIFETEGNFGIILLVDDAGGVCSIKQQSWTPGLNDVYFLSNGTGWAVGDAGTIIKTGEGVSFVEEEEIDEIPTDYSLSNNFPNPFNPSTKIRYSVPKTSRVSIKVYDILGNEIETLVKGEKSAGTYELSWYAEKSSSGIYFYRIQAGDFIETKKMMLLK
jgi:photosystem II stability/assembly factor-like uncharacterized protein